MHIKNIKKYIRVHEIGIVSVWWSVVMIIGWIMLLALSASTHVLEFLFIGSIVFIVLIVFALGEAKKKSYRILNHIQNEIDNFDQETFQKLDQSYNISANCLVYHNGTKFIVVKKENIQSIHFDGKKILLSQKNKDGVYLLPCRIETNTYIQQWLN